MGRSSAPGLWVIGPCETASYVHHLGQVIKPSVTVNLGRNTYYRFHYDYALTSRQSLLQPLVGPAVLGYLLHRATGFVYLGRSGFLIGRLDGRAYEFRFIKQKGKQLACFFVGTDIRSPQLMLDYARAHETDVMQTYYGLLHPETLTEAFERATRLVAEVAERYADQVFSMPVDQMSYFTRPVHPVPYIYPNERFQKNDAKYTDLQRPKIVHAPSSPVIKGTPLVRAAIKKLRLEGYDFDYVELCGVPNEVVLRELASAHIVLNEFYAFVPGVFGIEALAAHCALLTSADETIEPALPAGANEAWLVTTYWQVYDHLKLLLDERRLIKAYADKGLAWARANCAYDVAASRLKDILGCTSDAP